MKEKVTQDEDSSDEGNKAWEPPEGSLHAGSTRPTDCDCAIQQLPEPSMYASRLFTPLSGKRLNAGELSTIT